MRFENLTCVHSHGLTLGSEMSGGIEDILFKNISVGQAFAAVRVKSARGRGGYIKDVVYEDIRAGSVLSGVWVDMDCTPQPSTLPNAAASWRQQKPARLTPAASAVHRLGGARLLPQARVHSHLPEYHCQRNAHREPSAGAAGRLRAGG